MICEISGICCVLELAGRLDMEKKHNSPARQIAKFVMGHDPKSQSESSSTLSLSSLG